MVPQLLTTAEDLTDAFHEWNELLYRYTFARVRDQQMSQDIVQEVFFKAWRARDSFDPEKSSLKSWLFTITLNTIRDHFRGYKGETAELPEELWDEQELSAEVADRDLVRYVFSKIKQLSPRDQELLILRYTEGLSVQEIATIVGSAYSATKVALHRALQKLKVLCQEKSA